MKIRLLVIVSISTVFACAQKPVSFNVTLVGWRGDGRESPQKFDTIFLNRTFDKTAKIYTNVSIKDTSFTITDVPIGKYWLVFSTKSFCVTPFPIVVCSKCENSFVFFPSSKKPGDNCNIFEMVEVEPSYIGGDKALSKDFQRNLNRAEKKRLKASGDFTVHFYLTKQGAISDPSFSQSDLSEDLRNIILRCLGSVANWRPAVRNGNVADVELSLDKHSLLSN